MSTILTFDDYADPDWGSIELSSDWQSYRSFWTAVLQFATADGAEAVLFDLRAAKDCLVVQIDGKKFSMAPPPLEFRRQLLDAIRRFAVGGTLRWAAYRLSQVFGDFGPIGRVELETPSGNVIWQVSSRESRIRLQRLNW